MAEFQKRKAQEDLSAALASMGLQMRVEASSPSHEKAMGPGATTPSAIAKEGVFDVRYSPEPPAPPAAAAPREPDKP
jgi:hypothetical protein